MIIAHRLSTLLHAERIVVLDQGSVVGDGTHAELLTGCQAYADLVGPSCTHPWQSWDDAPPRVRHVARARGRGAPEVWGL